MGIDRFDNDHGYMMSNVVPSCWTCNNIKSAHTWPDVKTHLQAIMACSITKDLTDAAPFNPRGCETSTSDRIKGLKRSALKRGHELGLSDEKMEEFFSSNCVYCDASPNPHNGIDRVDNDNGYTKENSVACCTICNFMKGVMTKVAFLTHVERMVLHAFPTTFDTPPALKEKATTYYTEVLYPHLNLLHAIYRDGYSRVGTGFVLLAFEDVEDLPAKKMFRDPSFQTFTGNQTMTTITFVKEHQGKDWLPLAFHFSRTDWFFPVAVATTPPCGDPGCAN